ncbi:hypothetical protein Ae201684_001935 [Aphanomyces euteiches]|uniref:Uncharacterized protein n=1 Tax=Aphanomyces euteiches TaxID=100861 RepID=A0A6G0XRW4_9STRA|nr:hypothetical protein Ae201684_001935 [Aphanomyces euteiches]
MACASGTSSRSNCPPYHLLQRRQSMHQKLPNQPRYHSVHKPPRREPSSPRQLGGVSRLVLSNCARSINLHGLQ